MQQRDPLRVLMKLRQLEVSAATRLHAARRLALEQAEGRHAEALAAIDREAGHAVAAGYASWLPVALAEAQRAARAETQQSEKAESARLALTEARCEKERADRLVEARQREVEQARAKKEAERLSSYLCFSRR
jgi:hypothetical protein